jgi:talin
LGIQVDLVNAEGWLNPDRTLREHGLTEEDYVVLKKKFFVTDQNVDRSDPVQLMMMYTQGSEMILSGKLPCTAEEAAQFGGISMQIKFGNHDPSKHKPGFIKLKEFVPPEFQKSKDIEKAIYKEHAILSGTTELNAKFRYVQLVRSLKTYGTSFFLVKVFPSFYLGTGRQGKETQRGNGSTGSHQAIPHSYEY